MPSGSVSQNFEREISDLFLYFEKPNFPHIGIKAEFTLPGFKHQSFQHPG